jgi:hypothetical protein
VGQNIKTALCCLTSPRHSRVPPLPGLVLHQFYPKQSFPTGSPREARCRPSRPAPICRCRLYTIMEWEKINGNGAPRVNPWSLYSTRLRVLTSSVLRGGYAAVIRLKLRGSTRGQTRCLLRRRIKVRKKSRESYAATSLLKPHFFSTLNTNSLLIGFVI